MHLDDIIANEALWPSTKPHPRKAVMSTVAHLAERIGWAGSWGCFLDLLLAYLERISHEDADERWIKTGERFDHDRAIYDSFKVSLISLIHHFYIRRGFCDVLGPVHQEVSSRGARSAMGQFFTPWGVCLLNAQMLMGDRAEPLKPDGSRWSVCDPAVGSGALLLAAKGVFAQRFGFENVDLLEVAGQDIDYTAIRACRAQMYLSSPGRCEVLLATDRLKSEDARLAARAAGTLSMLSALMSVTPKPVEPRAAGQLQLL